MMKSFYQLQIIIILLFATSLLKAQPDTIPPHIKCKDVHTNNTPAGYITLYASDFIDTLSDNQAGSLPILLGMRKICTGTGFPENMTSLDFFCHEYSKMEIWARDAAGNTQYDQCWALVADNLGNCDPTYS